MCQHEQLGFGVRRGPNCRDGKPGITDLADIRGCAPMQSMACRPCPMFDVPEACRSDHDIVSLTHNGEWHGCARISPCQRGLDVPGEMRAQPCHSPLCVRLTMANGTAVPASLHASAVSMYLVASS